MIESASRAHTRRSFHFGILALCALAPFLGACASGPGHADVIQRIPALEEGMGRVFFYRPSSMAGGLKPPIMVDTKRVGLAQSKGFTFADLEPGDYTVSTSTIMEHSLPITVVAGRVKYVRLASSAGLIAGHILPSLTTEAKGKSEMSSLKYTGDMSVLTD